MSPHLVLVPSPLLRSDSWGPAAQRLRDRGHDVSVAELDDSRAPLWRAHAESAARAVAGVTGPYALVAHSGAGALLPAIAHAAGRRPAAAVYVDAGLPVDQTTRLEQIAMDAPDVAVTLRASLEGGGRYPDWTDEQIEPLVPDANVRAGLLAGVRPRDLAFFTEPIPAPGPAMPSGYVRLSEPYDLWARIARDRGWPTAMLDGGHFQLLVDPDSVAAAIVEVLEAVPAVTEEAVGLGDVRFDTQGVVPAVVQQYDTGEVLMVAWMTRETLAETLDRGETVFWSRSRQQRWHKGETSGNTQRVVEVIADCDADVLLVRVDQQGDGVACHTGQRTCFHNIVRP